MFDFVRFSEFLTDAANHYEKTAPVVTDYINDLYIRCGERPAEVRLVEILRVQGLLADDEWEHPNYAANRIYHLMHDVGLSTTGQAGF